MQRYLKQNLFLLEYSYSNRLLLETSVAGLVIGAVTHVAINSVNPVAAVDTFYHTTNKYSCNHKFKVFLLQSILVRLFHCA